MAKTKALVKRATGALEPWEQDMAAMAKDEKSQETLGVPRITHRGGVLKVGDKVVNGGLKLAVVDYVFEKAYYATDFDPGNPATPDCYAFARPQPGEKAGDTESRMVAHEAAPSKQHLGENGTSPCKGCQHNAFGTAKVGRGKACKDIRRLLVLSPKLGGDGKPLPLDADTVDRAELRQISVPPASLRAFGDYYTALADKTRTGNIREAIVEINTEKSERGGHVLTFEFAGAVPSEGFKSIAELYAKKKDALMTPYPVLGGEDEAPSRVKRDKKSNKKLD